MPVTGYSGLWNGVFDQNYSLQTNKPSLRKHVARLVRGSRASMRVTRELLDTLIGAAAGDPASATYKRVPAIAQLGEVGQGGLVTIETRTMISRNTDAADVTALKAELVNERFVPSSYPTDASGNGGGGKLGF